MSTVKAFFEFCLSTEWITRNPARLVKNPRGRDAADRRNEQKLPFTDLELQRMYEACATKYGKQEVGRSLEAMWCLSKRGTFPVVRTDGRVRFDVQDLDR